VFKALEIKMAASVDVYNLFNAVIVAELLQTSTSTKEYCGIYLGNILYCGKTCYCVLCKL